MPSHCQIFFLYQFKIYGTHAAHSGACPSCSNLALHLFAAQPLSGDMRQNADVAPLLRVIWGTSRSVYKITWRKFVDCSVLLAIQLQR